MTLVSQRSIVPVPGGTVAPADVVGRDELISEALRLIDQGNALLMTDPRRMGKTSVLRRLQFLSAHPRHTVLIDYEGVRSVDDFLRSTAGALSDHTSLGSRMRNAVSSFFDRTEIETRRFRLSRDYESRSPNEVLRSLIERVDRQLRDDEKLILALDEVPLAVANIARSENAQAANLLLQTLRSQRSRRPSKIGWLITGSVGFHHVLRLANATEGAVNDLYSLHCGPLDEDAATDLAASLLVGTDRSAPEPVVAAIVEQSGRIPFLMHLLVAGLAASSLPLEPPSIEEVWRDQIVDPDRSRGLAHSFTRLPHYYGEQSDDAYRVLDETAAAIVAVEFDELAGNLDRNTALDLVDRLVADHYLVSRAAGVEWRYEALRRIWVLRRRL